MANPKLTVEIGADLTELGSGINKAASTVEKGAKQMTAATGQVDKSFDKLSKDVSKSMSNVSSSTSKASNDVSKSLAKVAQQTNAMGGGVSKGANEASVALTNFGRIAQDLPYGMMGISNNLNPMIESFGRLRKETGSTGGALKAMASGLMGAGGLGIAVSAISAAMSFAAVGMTYWKSRTAEATKEIEKAKNASNEFAESLGSVDRALLKGTQNAEAQLIPLKTLYEATQNTSLSLNERKKAVDLLQEQYPLYFKNISDEIILAGKAEEIYIRLTKSILAKARAKAVEDDIVAIQKEIRGLEKQNDLNLAAQKIADERFKRETAINNKNIEGLKTTNKLQLDLRKNSELFYKDEETGLLVERSISDIRSARAGIETNLNTKIRERKELEEELQKNIKENGVDAIDTTKNQGKELDKIAEIYKRLNAELKSNPLEFGATKIDIAENNIKSYQKAIDDLILNGYAPASKAVQNLIDKQEKLAKVFITPDLAPSVRGGMRESASGRIEGLGQNFDIIGDVITKTAGLSEYEKLVRRAEESNNRFIESLNQVGKAALSSGIGEAFNSIGEALATGGNFIDAAGNAILSVMANFLNQLGQMFIKEGIAQIAFGVAQNLILPGSGANRVAGGVGMIAAGGLISIAGGAAGARGKGKSAKDPVKPIRAFATGGYNLPSGMALVGERGPEIVNLPTGSDVYNNNKTMGMLSRANNDSIVLQGDLGISLETLYFRLKKVEQNINR